MNSLRIEVGLREVIDRTKSGKDSKQLRFMGATQEEIAAYGVS
jgi:hypothetical protein